MPDRVTSPAEPIRVLTFSTLYPNSSQPNHGIFVETRLRHLVASGAVTSRVVAPVPWFPFTGARFGDYGRFAQVVRAETRAGLDILHPRYLVIPKVGMSLAPALLYAACLPALRRLVAEERIDLIDAHYFYPDGVAATWLGRVLNKPVVITARGTDVNLIPQFARPRRMIQSAARAAAGIIAVSEAIRQAIIALGVPPGKVTVLRNGVDLDLFAPQDRNAARRRLGLEGRVLLSVGHLIARKDHGLIIAALPRLADYRLVIAGEGPERSRLEALALRLGVQGRVRFLGAVPHRELPPLYTAADALVLASSREGWPNVLLEAMACGTPVVASDIWGNPEVVSRPDAGVLMRERTVDGVVEGVTRLFASLPGRERTRRYAEDFNWDATTEGQIALFRKILGRVP